MEPKEQIKRSEKIINWIKSHKCFTYNELCREIGHNAGNFKREMDSGKIPVKRIEPIETILKEYGFKEK